MSFDRKAPPAANDLFGKTGLMIGTHEAERYMAGEHMQAFLAMQRIYAQRLQHARAMFGRVEMLDFGTGSEGVSRCICEPLMKTGDHLGLYDPYTTITPPLRHASIVHDADVFGSRRRHFNIISMSYVLCCMEPKDAVDALERLRTYHPCAEIVIVDYMLKGREDLVALLNADEELQWKERLGMTEFVRSRTQFNVQELRDLLSRAGIPAWNKIQYLDSKHIRAATIVDSAESYGVAY